jgi:hypothetical protein
VFVTMELGMILKLVNLVDTHVQNVLLLMNVLNVLKTENSSKDQVFVLAQIKHMILMKLNVHLVMKLVILVLLLMIIVLNVLEN